MTLYSSSLNKHSKNPHYSSTNSTNTIKSKGPKTKEEKKAAISRLYDKYHDFGWMSSTYCKYCTSQCKLYLELRGLRRNKLTSLQATIPKKVNAPLNYNQYKNELLLLKKNRIRRIGDLREECSKCANKRLYQYEILGFHNLFNFLKDLNTPHKPRFKSETKSSEDCCHRIEIRCTQKRIPVDFCTYDIPNEIKKSLLAFLRENENKCNCNETSKKYCPYINSCEEIIARKLCPETIDNYS